MNNICCGGTKAGGIIMAVLLAVLAVYVAALAVNAVKSNKYIGRDAATQSTISVAGSGDVYVAPDLAVMDFSVVSEAKTVADAMADNTKKANAIIDVVKSLGVAEKDLQTTNFNVTPHYDNVNSQNDVIKCTPESCPMPIGTKRVLTGYDITQTLTVKMRDMAKIGQIIEEATASGANQVGDLQFTLDDPDAVKADARQKAIVDAKAKADKLANQLGVKLGRITGFSEGGYYPSSQINYAAKDAGGGIAAVAPNIQVGENKTTVNVSITYEIQ